MNESCWIWIVAIWQIWWDYICVGSSSTLHRGATLLLSVPLLFSKTARFEGKLFVKALGSLEGPCFAFKEDAFIQSSAEMHFGDCHNVAKSEAGSTGGAIHVRGNLTVTGNLSIHNCSARLGGSLGLKYLWPVPSGWWRVSFSVSSCLRCLCSDWSSGFWHLLMTLICYLLWQCVTLLTVRDLTTWWQWGPCLSWNPQAKADKFFCFLRMFLLLPVMTQDSI